MASPAALFALSAVMMIAMMLPSAVPRIARRGVLFGAGYLFVWIVFSGAATLVQYALDRAGFLSQTMALTSVPLAALVVAGAGLYQFAPLKRSCLARCRMDAGDRDGMPRQHVRAVIGDGIRVGFACVGCCWALMALPLVAGMLNVAALVAITALILIERTVPRGAGVAKLAGIALVACSAMLPLAR